MAGISFEVSIGAQKASSQARGSDWQLLSLITEIGMDGVGHCAVELAASEARPPKPGEAARVSLGAGGGSAQVFTGEALSVSASAETLVVRMADGLAKLARLEVEGAYEDATAGSIAKELLQKASLTAGTVEDGPTLTTYVLHRGPRALQHLLRLAERSGFDVYADGGGKVHFAAARTGSADHTFTYGKELLRVELAPTEPAYDSVVVWGEGAAGTQGADKAHWLVTDLASVSGKASLGDELTVKPGSEGKQPLTVKDGAVRSQADATDLAQARLKALAVRPLRGFVEVLGAPAVAPGDLVKLDGLPKGHALRTLAADEALRVRRVRHALSARQGFITRMEL
jgi:phage protein D